MKYLIAFLIVVVDGLALAAAAYFIGGPVCEPLTALPWLRCAPW